MAEGGFIPEGAIPSKDDMRGVHQFGHEANPPGGANSERLQAKVAGALARIGDIPGVSREAVQEQIFQKRELLDRFIRDDPGMIFSENMKGEFSRTTLDPNGDIDVSTLKKPESRLRIATDYVSTEAAISSLYTSSGDVQPLPPEAFRAEFPGLSRQIDENGVLLTVVGHKAPGIKTKFYRMPGQQLDEQRKQIPLYQQKLLVVQERRLPDGRLVRSYAVSNVETLSDYAEGLIEAQKMPAAGRTDQNSPVNPEQASSSETELNEQPQLDEAAIALTMDYVNKLASSVLAGRSQPGALQTYVEYAIRKGVPKDRIEALLREKGINVQRKPETQSENQDQLSQENPLQTIRPILDKLNAPGQAGEVMRLGNEVILNADEISQLQLVLSQAIAELSSNPDIIRMNTLIEQLKQNQAFGISMMFSASGIVEEDNNINSPQVIPTQAGPKIHVPSAIYKLWNSEVNITNAQRLLEEYQTEGYKGKSATMLAGNIIAGLNYKT